MKNQELVLHLDQELASQLGQEQVLLMESELVLLSVPDYSTEPALQMEQDSATEQELVLRYLQVAV